MQIENRLDEIITYLRDDAQLQRDKLAASGFKTNMPCHTDASDMFAWRAADTLAQIKGLVECLIFNDPDDMAADGVTVLDVWRKEARSILSIKAGR